MGNKQTLLVVQALKKGNYDQKLILKKCLGNRELTKKDLTRFRKVVIDTGSLEYSQKLCKKLVKKALAALKKIEFKNKEAEVFLKGIAEYIINREK